MFSTDPETQIQTEALTAVLRELPVNGLATYQELSASAGFNVKDKPFVLIKARQHVEKETGLRFSTVRSQGVKKLDSEAIAGIGAAARANIANKAKRHAARLTGLKYNNIPPEDRARIDAERSLLGSISAMAKADVGKIAEHTSTGPIVAAKVFGVMTTF